MRLVDGYVLRRAVDFACGRVDDPSNAALTGRLEDVVRSFHVGAHVGERRDVGVRDADEGREVVDRVATRHRGFHEVVVADVTGDDLHGVPAGRVLKPSPEVPGVVAEEGADLVPLFDKLFHEVGGDEAAGTCDHYSHALDSPFKK